MTHTPTPETIAATNELSRVQWELQRDTIDLYRVQTGDQSVEQLPPWADLTDTQQTLFGLIMIPWLSKVRAAMRLVTDAGGAA